MNKRNLAAIWWQFAPPRPKEEKLAAKAELRHQEKQWNQEEKHFQNGSYEINESLREKVRLLAPSFGDMKKLVL
jgi:hypothetical protein